MNSSVYSNHNDESIHCLGNGKMAVYEQGPDIIQIFGPPYSSPSFMKMMVMNMEKDSSIAADYKIISEREQGTAIWTHTIFEYEKKVGEIIDFVDSHTPCFIRKVKLDIPLRFKVYVEKFVKTMDNTGRYNSLNINKALLATCEPGAYIYGKYPMPVYSYYQMFMEGQCEYENMDDGEYILCNEGESTIYITGGTSYKECIVNTRCILDKGFLKALDETKDWWSRFSNRRKSFGISGSNSERLPGLEEVVDSISVVIKTQQEHEGGVLAGHYYHLGYVRDQYGVSRCLLKLGYYEEARKILDFYWNIWKRFGRIHNAQGIGVDNVFHVHENDEVEITGYLIIQAFDYMRESGDNEYIKAILPMLEWAWEAQKKHLLNGMLPFNGDETYVAGGILPRHTLNDGSAEATLLFIEGGKRLFDWIERNETWDKAKLEQNKKILDDTVSSYRSNFFRNGVIITNNPERSQVAELPLFRHGVCEGCGAFGWTEKNENNRYVCPDCYKNKNVKTVEPKVYELKSVSLMPLYIGSDMFSKEEIYTLVNKIMNNYKRTGKLPSSPDGEVAVGYDYGLLLYNLVKLDHPDAFKIYEVMMAALDSTCAWVEYYRDGVPSGTRYRPWESGINLEAAILYAERQ